MAVEMNDITPTSTAIAHMHINAPPLSNLLYDTNNNNVCQGKNKKTLDKFLFSL